MLESGIGDPVERGNVGIQECWNPGSCGNEGILCGNAEINMGMRESGNAGMREFRIPWECGNAGRGSPKTFPKCEFWGDPEMDSTLEGEAGLGISRESGKNGIKKSQKKLPQLILFPIPGPIPSGNGNGSLDPAAPDPPQ